MRTTLLREQEPLLMRREVAALFGVNVKTVDRWADAGRLDYLTTPGGHRRFKANEVRALLTRGGTR